MTANVVVLHGLGRTKRAMTKIVRALEGANFTAHPIGYPSMTSTIEALTETVFNALPKVDGKLHFVGHSLGGILAVKIAHQLPVEQRGRIVQLSSPNFGSEIAERAAVFGKLMGPALAQLTPKDGDSIEDLEIAAIAGTAAVPAYGLITGISGQNDGKVSVESAWGHVPRQNCIKLPVSHSTMMNDPRVIDATVSFLRTGELPNPD